MTQESWWGQTTLQRQSAWSASGQRRTRRASTARDANSQCVQRSAARSSRDIGKYVFAIIFNVLSPPIYSPSECEILSRCQELPEALKFDPRNLAREQQIEDDSIGEAARKSDDQETAAYSLITPLRMLLLEQEGGDKWRRTKQVAPQRLT